MDHAIDDGGDLGATDSSWFMCFGKMSSAVINGGASQTVAFALGFLPQDFLCGFPNCYSSAFPFGADALTGVVLFPWMDGLLSGAEMRRSRRKLSLAWACCCACPMLHPAAWPVQIPLFRGYWKQGKWPAYNVLVI